jgi:AraC family transcriptional regulator of adaptative response/methylated-DNA-[protein]-cysteine methyltransferase
MTPLERMRRGGLALVHPVPPGVILEAATPAEIKAQGRGMTLTAGVASTPFGDCLIADSPRGICHLSFFDPGGKIKAIEELCSAWHHAEIIWDHAHTARLGEEIFTPAPPSREPLAVFVCGTEFQLRVWRALVLVPPGACVSYAMLAAAAGNPQACRATGSAVGANPVSFLIPCHRVIRSDGTPGQYRWGAVRKKVMLAWESPSALRQSTSISSGA